MEELQAAMIAGKKYEDIQGDVVRLVNYFVNKFYELYPVLKRYNCDREFVVMDVYRGLYLKTKDDGLSNLERHFIKASKIENVTMSYISNLIRKSVTLSMSCLSRDLSKKPLLDSLDRVIQHDGDKDTTLADIVSDNSNSLEKSVELKLTLESIKHKTFKEYYYIGAFGEKKKLTTAKVLDWVINGYKITEMKDKVFKKKDNSNIEFKNMSEIKKLTINLAREAFFED